MPAAIAVPAIIGAGASVGTAAIGARAAGKAAKQQEQASDQAMAFQQRAYTDQQAAMQPYMRTGTDVFQRLAENYGRGAYSPGGPSPFGAQSPFAQALQPGGMGYSGQQPQPQMVNQAMPRVGGPMPSGPQAGGRPFAAAMGGGGDLVTIQAPTGETRQMPRQEAQAYLARGARMVG